MTSEVHLGALHCNMPLLKGVEYAKHFYVHCILKRVAATMHVLLPRRDVVDDFSIRWTLLVYAVCTRHAGAVGSASVVVLRF